MLKMNISLSFKLPFSKSATFLQEAFRATGKSPDREQEVFRPGSVATGKCPDREMSNRRASRPGNVVDLEVFRPDNVRPGYVRILPKH